MCTYNQLEDIEPVSFVDEFRKKMECKYKSEEKEQGTRLKTHLSIDF